MDRSPRAFEHWPASGRQEFRQLPRGWMIIGLALASWLLVLGIGLGIAALIG